MLGHIANNGPLNVSRTLRHMPRRFRRTAWKWRWRIRCRVPHMPQPSGTSVRSPCRARCNATSFSHHRHSNKQNCSNRMRLRMHSKPANPSCARTCDDQAQHYSIHSSIDPHHCAARFDDAATVLAAWYRRQLRRWRLVLRRHDGHGQQGALFRVKASKQSGQVDASVQARQHLQAKCSRAVTSSSLMSSRVRSLCKDACAPVAGRFQTGNRPRWVRSNPTLALLSFRAK